MVIVVFPMANPIAFDWDTRYVQTLIHLEFWGPGRAQIWGVLRYCTAKQSNVVLNELTRGAGPYLCHFLPSIINTVNHIYI